MKLSQNNGTVTKQCAEVLIHLEQERFIQASVLRILQKFLQKVLQKFLQKFLQQVLQKFLQLSATAKTRIYFPLSNCRYREKNNKRKQ